MSGQTAVSDNWDVKGEVVAAAANGENGVEWVVQRSTADAVTYRADTPVNGITGVVSLHRTTSEDGSEWVGKKRLSIEGESSEEIVTQLYGSVSGDDGHWDNRDAATGAVKSLLGNLTSEVMVKQFVEGTAVEWFCIENRSVVAAAQYLTSPGEYIAAHTDTQ